MSKVLSVRQENTKNKKDFPEIESLTCNVEPNAFEDDDIKTANYSASNRERSTPDQLRYLFDFMTANVNLLKGVSKKRIQADSKNLWMTLTHELNELGPPKRSTTEWKKIWASNKFKLKKKLSVKYTSSRMRSFGCSVESLDSQVKGIFVQKKCLETRETVKSPTKNYEKSFRRIEKLQEMKHSCRICLESNTLMKSLGTKLADMYAAVIGKPLEFYGDVSMKICNRCNEELTRAYDFRLVCLKTEEQILTLKSNTFTIQEVTQEKMPESVSGAKDSMVHQLCNLCGKMLKAESMKAHLKRHEADQEDPTVRPFICSECGRSYRTLCNLQSHMSYTHTKSKAFNCRHCDQVFTSYFRRRLHEGKCKLQQQPQTYYCPICHQAFHQISKRDDHVRVRHTFERPFQCSQCEKSFFTKRVLRRHMSIHSTQHRICCTMCSRRLHSLRSLATHMVNNHADEKISSCHLCPEAFPEERFLALHMREIHSQCHLPTALNVLDAP